MIYFQACQIESDRGLVSAYILFLSQHTTDLGLQELDELALVRYQRKQTAFYEGTGISQCENKDTDQLCNNCLWFHSMDSTLIPVLFSSPKLLASRLLLPLYRLVCVQPGRILKPVPLHRGSTIENGYHNIF